MEEMLEKSLRALKYIVENVGVSKSEDEEKELYESGKEMITQVYSNAELVEELHVFEQKNPLVLRHCNSVMALALTLANKFGMDDTKKWDIVIGGVFHDYGLTEVTVNYWDDEMSTVPAIDKLNYRRHVIIGYEKLQARKWMTDGAKMIVLSHHEKKDGSGYPFHKSGDGIPQEVSLITLCDHYTELVFGLGHKKRKNNEAIEFFETAETFLFDYDLMVKVVKNILHYPTGVKILTSEGEKGVIIRQTRGYRDRPVIGVMRNGRQEEIDLAQDLKVFIKQIID